MLKKIDFIRVMKNFGRVRRHWEATIRMPALQKCHEGSSHFLSLHDKPLQNAVTKQ